MNRTSRVRRLLQSSALLLCCTGTAGAQAAERAEGARVQAGDRIVVKVYREPTLSDTVMVNPRGEIVLARLGVIGAARMTIRELDDTLRSRYAKFLRDPAIDVNVLRKVVVNGEVAKSGVYYVDLASRLRDVIAIAGGITESGDPKKVSIVRDAKRIAAPNWEDDVSLASDLSSGDQIVVGQRPWLYRNALGAASAAAMVTSVLIAVFR